MTARRPGREVRHRSGSGPVDVQIRFERFPATVKGALVLRGADGNPHGVQVVEAAVARIPTGPEQPVPMQEVLVDVAPNHDLYVPFEAAISDLDPGWYAIRSSLRIDGDSARSFLGRPFPVAWERGVMRKANVTLERAVEVGGRTVQIERVEMTPEAAVVIWTMEADPDPIPAAAGAEQGVTALLLTGGEELEVLPDTALRTAGVRGPAVARPGQRRTVSYPVPRDTGPVQVVVRLASGERSEPLPILGR
jgi:hypothetical protein